MSIAVELGTSRVLYDKQTIMEAFEKEGVICWLNTNEHILDMFMTGFQAGEKYDPTKNFQEWKYSKEDFELSEENQPRASNLEYSNRNGTYWYFYDCFHDIETYEIVYDDVNKRVMYDNDTLLKATEKKDFNRWLNTNEHIIGLFMTGVRLGRKYDMKDEYQYDE
jgi:hypothetical protein